MEAIANSASVLESGSMTDRQANVVVIAIYVAGIKLGARKRGSRFFGECVKKVGDHLGMTRAAIYEWVKDGDLGKVKNPQTIKSFAELSGIEMSLLIDGIDAAKS